MANGAGTALGLSIGATNLAAVTSDHAVTRKPVLTRYPDRPAEVGVPAENPRLQGPGVVITGFVNRVGDPRPVVASDGSVHRSEILLADALRALAYAATGGRACPTTSPSPTRRTGSRRRWRPWAPRSARSPNGRDAPGPSC